MTKELNEEKIVQALDWHFQNPKENTIRQAAIRFRVTRSTLQNRANGGKSRQEAHQDQQLLFPAEEEELTKAVLAHADRGFPVRIPDLERWALEIVQRRDPNIKAIGEKWYERFFKRHPDIQTRWRQNMDRTRVAAADPESLAAFYNLVCFPFYSLEPYSIIF